MEEFNAIYDVAWEDPPEEGASEEVKASYKKRRATLTWYVEQWLPRCVDEKWFAAGFRPHERLSKIIDIGNKVYRARVSATREGYGFIQFENSRESWLNKFKWDDEQEKIAKRTGKKAKSAPNYSYKNKKDTKQFKSKWSDFGSGQKSKWDPLVYAEFELKIDKVENWRKEDELKNYKGQDFLMKLSRERQGLPDTQDVPTHKRKRGRGKRDEDDEDYTPPPQPKSYAFRDN